MITAHNCTVEMNLLILSVFLYPVKLMLNFEKDGANVVPTE